MHQSTHDGFYVPREAPTSRPMTTFYEPATTFVPPTSPETEPPLLEELGIDLSSIWTQTKYVMNPFIECSLDQTADLTGPLVFIVTFAFSLLFGMAKHYFGYIYGYTTIGCALIYALLRAMSDPNQSISLAFTVSALGYCLLPIVGLSFIWPLLRLSKLNSSLFAGSLACFAVAWSTYAATRLLTAAMDPNSKRGLRLLVGYPCMLFYVVFALFVVFRNE